MKRNNVNNTGSPGANGITGGLTNHHEAMDNMVTQDSGTNITAGSAGNKTINGANEVLA